MWNNYFYQIQNKYDMRLSLSEPLVIRFDGKNITKNKTLNLFDKAKGSFLDTLEDTAKYFTTKYNCYSILGSDEISFIIKEPYGFIKDIEPDVYNYSNEIIALFSQYFFSYFNQIYVNEKIFWHGKCFSIPKGKIDSYIKYRSGIIKNVMTYQFLKSKNINVLKTKLNVLEEQCKKYDDYSKLAEIKNGIIYYNGKHITNNDIENIESEKGIYNESTKIEIDY